MKEEKNIRHMLNEINETFKVIELKVKAINNYYLKILSKKQNDRISKKKIENKK